MRRKSGILTVLLIASLLCLLMGCTKSGLPADEVLKAEYFYQNVCASCEPEEEFYELVRFARDEGTELGEVITYNVFLEANRELFTERTEEMGIPEGTALPVLILGDQWACGEEEVSTLLLEGKGRLRGDPKEKERELADRSISAQAGALKRQLTETEEPVWLLFTTLDCSDCEAVKEMDFPVRILEKNIITDDCLGVMQALFDGYETEEIRRKVPVLFTGEKVCIGAGEIAEAALQSEIQKENAGLISMLETIEGMENAEAGGRIQLPLLIGAGFLAGLNPCSLSMLLMLLSVILTGKESVVRSGLYYLSGKYVAYFGIGWGIYTAAFSVQLSSLTQLQQIVNRGVALLFLAAAALYYLDARKVYRGDYGGIRTQLPVGLRRWNHNLIRQATAYKGILFPLLIAGLGIAVSVGEFFCTGQIYMAVIVYLLQGGSTAAWVYLLVYVTAMSLPAVLLVAVIQKTGNTDRISEFLFHRLFAVKVVTGTLFLGFAIYLFLI